MESKTTAIGSHGDGNKIMAMGKQGDQKQVKQDVGKEAGGGAQECCKECGQASDNTTSQTNYDKKKDWRSNKAKVDDAKKDDPKEDEIKNANDTESQGFTDAQDAKIKQMKANNKSWNDIAIEVGVSKKDVTARYKKLRETDDKKKVCTSMFNSFALSKIRDLLRAQSSDCLICNGRPRMIPKGIPLASTLTVYFLTMIGGLLQNHLTAWKKGRGIWEAAKRETIRRPMASILDLTSFDTAVEVNLLMEVTQVQVIGIMEDLLAGTQSLSRTASGLRLIATC